MRCQTLAAIAASAWLWSGGANCYAQSAPPAAPTGGPRVSIPVGQPARQPVAAGGVPQQAGRAGQQPVSRVGYPWKQNITATVFWIGEQPTARNPTPNTKSSWDQEWVKNFGGFDDPDPAKRHHEYRPQKFVPKLNPFYIALPYNDVAGPGDYRPEAPRAIPWFGKVPPGPNKTVCKGRWLQIVYAGKSCFAQWEDCGPWVTDDWEYVFGNRPPKNTANNSAAIDISPAVRDYLGMRSGEKVHWRFVEASQVPHGPWLKFGGGTGNPAAAGVTAAAGPPSAEVQAAQLRSEQLRRVRDEIYKNKSKWELQGGY